MEFRASAFSLLLRLEDSLAREAKKLSSDGWEVSLFGLAGVAPERYDNRGDTECSEMRIGLGGTVKGRGTLR
jgi:hypothetical protein